MKQIIDLTWKKFWRLTVIERKQNDNGKHICWLCECECGIEKIIRWQSLRLWISISCGCYRKELMTTHWDSNHPMYSTWAGIIARCYNKHSISFRNYGWRGISVCDEWIDSFQNFVNDMYGSFTEWLQIDRKDSDRNYCKENCRWVTPKENCRNKRNNKIIEYKWESKCLAEWCDILWLNYRTTLKKIYRWCQIDLLFNKQN